MSLAYYKAVRKRLARRRLDLRKAALAAEKILQETPDYSMRCERPGCSHVRADHAAQDGSTKGGCCVAFCRCRGYYLGPAT